MWIEYAEVIGLLGAIIGIIFGLGMLTETLRRRKVIKELDTQLAEAYKRIDDLVAHQPKRNYQGRFTR